MHNSNIMEYIELTCTLSENDLQFSEIIMAALGELGFESFTETESGLQAYIQAPAFDPAMLNDPNLWPEGAMPAYTWQTIEDQNWNAVWESNFDPVLIAGRCAVRAPFHEPFPGVEFDIVIEPKMSFGTAHHETTYQVIEVMLGLDLAGKTVLDMGCGTAVLAILAAMKGASQITAIDNDEWAFNNSLENVQKNNFPDINVYQGDAAMLDGLHFDIIIANINRNILLNDMGAYQKALNPGGMLIMSGFYTEDVPAITGAAKNLGLEFAGQTQKNNWATASFIFRNQS